MVQMRGMSQSIHNGTYRYVHPDSVRYAIARHVSRYLHLDDVGQCTVGVCPARIRCGVVAEPLHCAHFQLRGQHGVAHEPLAQGLNQTRELCIFCAFALHIQPCIERSTNKLISACCLQQAIHRWFQR